MTLTHPPRDELAELRDIAAFWHDGQASALAAFASTGVVLDAEAIAAEVELCVATVERNPGAYDDPEAELDRLYELTSHVAGRQTHFHLGMNVTGFLPEVDPRCVRDADEALAAYLDLARSFADEDDDTTRQWLYDGIDPDDYPCVCGHPATCHADTHPLPCGGKGCDCGAYQPNLGDDEPATRALVDAILADAPPVLGRPYAMSVTDCENTPWEIWLHVELVDADAGCGLDAP